MLNIPTKINKGTVEILAPVDLIKKGDKVGSSEAALLAKLGIRPFSYGLVITDVYEDGLVFSREVLDLMDEDLIEKFSSGICMVASLSLAISYPTMAGAAHMFVNGYKNVLAIATETNYSYPHADQIKEYLKENLLFLCYACWVQNVCHLCLMNVALTSMLVEPYKDYCRSLIKLNIL